MGGQEQPRSACDEPPKVDEPQIKEMEQMTRSSTPLHTEHSRRLSGLNHEGPFDKVQEEKARGSESNLPADLQPPNKLPTDATAGDQEWEYVTGYQLSLVMAAVTIACFLILLDTSVVVTAIPRITTDFHSLRDIGWYGSSYLLGSTALQPTAGKLYKQFSSKYVFISFLAFFELGSLLCGVATSSNMLIVGRAVAGMGVSGIINGALTIVAACVPLEKRAIYLGFLISFGQIGILLGPLIGGLFTQYTTWRWCFFINLPIGGLAIIFILFIHIPDRRSPAEAKATISSTLQSLDIPGFVIFAPAAIQFLLAVEWGGTKYTWNSSTIIGLFCGSAGTLALFLVWEYKRGDAAMIPFSMVRQRVVWCSCLTVFFVFSNLLTTSYYLAIYFQAIKGVSPTMSGVYYLPSVLSQMPFAIISGILVNRLGYYLPFAVICGVLITISAGLMSTLAPGSGAAEWIGYQIIGGIGRGCGMQMPILAIQNTLKPDQISLGMALVSFSQTLGATLFLSFDQTTFSNGLKSALEKYAPEVNAQEVISAGATGFRGIVSKSSLPGVISAYNYAFSHVFYVATGTGAAALMFSFGLGWKSVKKAKAVAPKA